MCMFEGACAFFCVREMRAVKHVSMLFHSNFRYLGQDVITVSD